MIKTAAVIVVIIIIFALYVMLTGSSKSNFVAPLDCPYRGMGMGPGMRMRRRMFRNCPYHENCPYYDTCPKKINYF